jgi:hypothetical protein
MPTLREANLRRKRYAWMVKTLMEEKVLEAERRLLTLRERESGLKKVHEEYKKLYDKYIKPLEPQARKYIADTFEIRKLESFLQTQREKEKEFLAQGALSGTENKVEYLRYAGKSLVGHKPRSNMTTTDQQRNLNKLANMDPKVLATLLEKAGVK